MKIGRWKGVDTFYNHYIAARLAENTTDKILGIIRNEDDRQLEDNTTIDSDSDSEDELEEIDTTSSDDELELKTTKV